MEPSRLLHKAAESKAGMPSPPSPGGGEIDQRRASELVRAALRKNVQEKMRSEGARLKIRCTTARAFPQSRTYSARRVFAVYVGLKPYAGRSSPLRGSRIADSSRERTHDFNFLSREIFGLFFEERPRTRPRGRFFRNSGRRTKKTPLTAGTVNGGKESQMETLALVLIMIFLIIQSMKNQ